MKKKDSNLNQLLEEAIEYHSNKNYQKAEELYKKILNKDPNHADANHNMAVLALQHNKPQYALILLEKITNNYPNNSQYKTTLTQAKKMLEKNGYDSKLHHLEDKVMKLMEDGNYDNALQITLEAIDIYPKSFILLKSLGYIYMMKNDNDQSVYYFERSIEIEESDYSVFNNLGIVYSRLNNLEKAKEYYQKSIEIFPNAEAYNNLGKLCVELEDYKNAEIFYNQAIKENDEFSEAYLNLGILFYNTDRIKKAELNYKKSLEINPHLVDAYNRLGILYCDKFEYKKAEDYYHKGIEIDSSYSMLYNNLARLYMELHRIEEAEQNYRKAIELNKEFKEPYHNLALLLVNTNRKDEAIKIFLKILKDDPENYVTHRLLSKYTKYTAEDKHLKELLDIYNTTSSKDITFDIALALSQAYDTMKNSDLSFKYLKEAKDILFNNSKSIMEKYINIVKFNKFLFSNIKEKNIQIDKNTSEKKPIFILGMPRSGTTLTEQIISSHSEVYGCGELMYIGRTFSELFMDEKFSSSDLNNRFKSLHNKYFEKVDKFCFKEKVFTDKMPHNFLQIGAILEAFPNAKIIHLNREPMAICWSMYKTYFPASGLEYCNNFKTLAEFYKLHDYTMKFWHKLYPEKIYELDYEMLTENQEEETRKLLEYCELSWEDGVLEPHKNKRAISTASNQQIRQKVYKGSSQAWKKYEKYLQPLIEELNKPLEIDELSSKKN